MIVDTSLGHKHVLELYYYCLCCTETNAWYIVQQFVVVVCLSHALRNPKNMFNHLQFGIPEKAQYNSTSCTHSSRASVHRHRSNSNPTHLPARCIQCPPGISLRPLRAGKQAIVLLLDSSLRTHSQNQPLHKQAFREHRTNQHDWIKARQEGQTQKRGLPMIHSPRMLRKRLHWACTPQLHPGLPRLAAGRMLCNQLRYNFLLRARPCGGPSRRIGESRYSPLARRACRRSRGLEARRKQPYRDHNCCSWEWRRLITSTTRYTMRHFWKGVPLIVKGKGILLCATYYL